MDKFNILYKKYINNSNKYLEWDLVEQINDQILTDYNNLQEINQAELKSKVCLIKLNGGLGTTMGCTGPKSLLKVKDDLTFLDIILEQSKGVQLVLMNSFYTGGQTAEYLNQKGIKNVMQFEQSCYPRILAENNQPLDIMSPNKNHLYPPGHGDLLQSLYDSGTLKELMDKGIEYAFVSNVDNLGAVIDYNILSDFIESNAEFGLELTHKTASDVKGGTLIKYKNTYKMFEVAQCPPDKLNEFTSVNVFKYFNTNNVWIKLSAIQKVIESNYLENVDIIINPKKLEDGQPCIQLEYAIGSMVTFFDRVKCYLVPRSRFIPVKRNENLALVRSDLYMLNDSWLLNKVE